jgi:hypothetical protein
MNPAQGSLLIALLLIAAFIACIGSCSLQPVKPNYTETNLVSNSLYIPRPYSPSRRGIPQRREGGGTR